MSEYFNHEVQSTDQANQVENLASEVDLAFTALEDDISKNNNHNASIGSSIGDLDNSYIKEYVPLNGWINNYQQELYFPRNSQEASLDLYPSYTTNDLNSVSVVNLTNPSATYTYKLNGVLQSESDFTFVDKKVVFGKTPDDSESLVITYKGYNTTDNSEDSFDLRYNVLQVKQPDNSIVNEFNYSSSGNTFTVSGYNFKDMCSEFIKNLIDNEPQDLAKYAAIYSDGVRIQTSSIEITNQFVRFITEDPIGNTVKIYVANASIGGLLQSIYRLFYAHDHGSNGGQGVNHGDLLGLYSNTYDEAGNPTIQYQTSTKTNYDHPQYINREGFIQDASIYNNAMLGDFLLSSTSNGNRRNNLDSNSVKLIFGEYSSGHKMFYNQNDDCLWLDSVSRDGLKLVTPDDRRALSINDHSFVDTRHISSNTDNALKLSVCSDSDEELGVFKITRKLLSDGSATEDDKAKFIAYASEYSFEMIKDTLTIAEGARISFGDPSVIDIVKEADGLHFTSNIGGSSTGAATVYFDIPIQVDQATVKHLDAEEVHLDATQKIVFGTVTHEDVPTQYINYENNSLNLKTTKGVNFKNNGRLTGISFDDRQSIYTSTPQGSSIVDTVEVTDLYIETKRDTYFLKSGYTYTQGITNLQSVPRSDVYVDTLNGSNVEITVDEANTNGIILNPNNKIFAQRDAQNNMATVLNSNAGVIVTYSYTPGSPLNYGKITAKEFYAEGNKDTSAGFYGNFTIPVNHKLVVNGETQFNSDIIYSKPVTFTDKVAANNIEAVDIKVNTLSVLERANYEELVTNNLEVIEDFRFSTMLQTNHLANSSFEGTVQFNNNVTMPNGNARVIIGDPDIEDERNNSGLLLSKDQVRLGTNGVVAAGKVMAGKGIPSGNGDTSGGFAFATTTGLPDGDTGFFAETNIELQNGSDLVFRIDGEVKGVIPKEDVDLEALSLAGKEKVLVTVEQLMSQVAMLSSNVLEKVYPIGTIYQNTVDGRNPSILLDWTSSVWRRHAVGRSIMGASGNGIGEQVDDFLVVPAGLNINAAGTKFGAYTHKLVKEELPAIRPEIKLGDAITSGETTTISSGGGLTNLVDTQSFQPIGNDVPHNNIHPIIIDHVWERIG